MPSGIDWIDLEACRSIARNSPVVKAMERKAAEGIYLIIRQTAPRATPTSDYAYADNFRIEQRQFPRTVGHITYVIAERFQWRWIEYGYTQWQTKKKYPGKNIMSEALEAYGRKGFK